MSVVLVYGGNGWLGDMMCGYLASAPSKMRVTVVKGRARCNDYEATNAEIERVCPSHVACFTGRVRMDGKNNIDCLEDAFEVNFRDNFWGPATLARICAERSIHFSYLGTGCIYTWRAEPYTETDMPNFAGSAYSRMKRATEAAVMANPQSAIFRIRLPQGADCTDTRSLIGKLGSFSHVTTTPNSMSVMTDVGPAIAAMILARSTGIYNATNGGALSNVEILKAYRACRVGCLLDAEEKETNAMPEEDETRLMVKRSNCILDNTKMQAELARIGAAPMKSAEDALSSVLFRHCVKEYDGPKEGVVHPGLTVGVSAESSLAFKAKESTTVVKVHRGHQVVTTKDKESGCWYVEDVFGKTSLVAAEDIPLKDIVYTEEEWAALTE